MAKVSKKQEQEFKQALETATQELNGATINPYTSSFSLELGEQRAYNLQLNGAVLLSTAQLANILGAEKDDGTRTGGMKEQAYAYLLDELSQAMPWLVIDTVNINDSARLFSLDVFKPRELDNDGNEKADVKQDARKRAIKRLLTTTETAKRIIDGAKRAGGVATLDSLYKAATKKNAADSVKKNYIFACWSLDYEPATMFNSCGATPEAYAMAYTKASDFATIADYAAAMEATAAHITAGDFANGQHNPAKN